MTKEQAEFFKKALENTGQEVEIIDDYSGRGMYGKTTYAIIANSMPDIIPSLLCHASHNYVDIVANGLFDGFELRQDNMGLGVVLY